MLGCRPVLVLAVRARALASSWWDVVGWFMLYSLVWATLVFVVPRVTNIFEKKRVLLPVPTRIIIGLAHFARSGPGMVTAGLVVVAVVLIFARWRAWRTVDYGLTALVISQIAFFPFAFFAIVLVLVNTVRV